MVLSGVLGFSVGLGFSSAEWLPCDVAEPPRAEQSGGAGEEISANPDLQVARREHCEYMLKHALLRL